MNVDSIKNEECSHVENFWGIVSPNDRQMQNIDSPVHILLVQKHNN